MDRLSREYNEISPTPVGQGSLLFKLKKVPGKNALSNEYLMGGSNMKPKIAIILTPTGIDTVTVLSTGSEARKAGYRLCSLLENEISTFEAAILKKLQLQGEEFEAGSQH